MAKMTTQEHFASAEKIVQLFDENKLDAVKVPYHQLDAWYRLNDDSLFQCRFERINKDSVKRIVSLIEFNGDLRYAKPVLVYFDKKLKKLVLINGNHTTAAIVESFEKGHIKLTEFDGQQIPESLLPKSDSDRAAVLEWVAILMNRDPQPKTKSTRKDVRQSILSEIARNGGDVECVNEPAYIHNLSNAYQWPIKDIQKVIAEAISDIEEQNSNELFNFYAWPEHRIATIEDVRSRELSTKHKTVHCTRAVVGDKTYESLGKAVGLALNHSQAHIVFHFPTSSKVSLRPKIENDIKEWMKFCSKPVTYEFLPYKSTEIDKFCDDNGLVFRKKASKKRN
jgi:hypothetical protein